MKVNKNISKTIRLTYEGSNYLNLIGKGSATKAVQVLINYHKESLSNAINYDEIHNYILEAEENIIEEVRKINGGK